IAYIDIKPRGPIVDLIVPKVGGRSVIVDQLRPQYKIVKTVLVSHSKRIVSFPKRRKPLGSQHFIEITDVSTRRTIKKMKARPLVFCILGCGNLQAHPKDQYKIEEIHSVTTWHQN